MKESNETLWRMHAMMTGDDRKIIAFAVRYLSSNMDEDVEEALDTAVGAEGAFNDSLAYFERFESLAALFVPDSETAPPPPVEEADLWREHPEHKRSHWIHEVGEGNTQLGYWDWVAHTDLEEA